MTGMLADVKVTARESRVSPGPHAPQEPRNSPRDRWQPPAHWPLSLALLGAPLWWALGVWTILILTLSLVMADQLSRRRTIALPGNFTLWALFLVWLGLGVFVLWADAPGAVPGGDLTRLLVFSYQVAWYLTCTIVMLWVANLSESELPTRWVYQLLGFMFVVTTIGGLCGVLLPHLEFSSPVEAMLPGGLRSNSFVRSIVHPGLADIQDVLGRLEARPKAPFPFANSWGANLALFLPFFLVAWFREGARWQKVAAPIVLVGASIPVIYSLNRGLWACLVLGAVLLIWLQLGKGRPMAVLASVVVLAVTVLALALSPLGTIFQERLDHQHSNDRRGQLLSQTVNSTVQGSPVVGFGSTRDVQGSFSSIAGASTPDCKACGVPPLGTQGHFWQLIFAQGLVGTLLFLSFFAMAMRRCWRCRTPAETLCTFTLAFFALLLPIYDTVGVPLMTVMVAVGLVTREQRGTAKPGEVSTVRGELARLRGRWPVLVVLTLLGAAMGAGLAVREQVQYSSRVSIQLSPSPVSLEIDETRDASRPIGDVTIDTEAALLTSGDALSRVVGSTDAAALTELSRRVRVTAVPNTRVLTLEIRDPSAARSQDESARLAKSYLRTRRAYLLDRRDQALSIYRAQLAKLQRSSTTSQGARLTLERLEREVATILITPTAAGNVINSRAPIAVRRQAEVLITSGAALGLAAGALLFVALPGWRPDRVRLRRRRRP